MESKHASVTKSRRVSQVVQLEIRVVGLLQLVEFFAAPPHLISISAKPQLPPAAKQIKRFFFCSEEDEIQQRSEQSQISGPDSAFPHTPLSSSPYSRPHLFLLALLSIKNG